MWDRPHRNTWVNKLNAAIRQADRPVILVAHSLGCIAVAWWAALERPPFGSPVAGALLVAPPDVDTVSMDGRLTAFGPAPKRSEEHTSELQSLMRISYAVFCLKKKNTQT